MHFSMSLSQSSTTHIESKDTAYWLHPLHAAVEHTRLSPAILPPLLCCVLASYFAPSSQWHHDTGAIVLGVQVLAKVHNGFGRAGGIGCVPREVDDFLIGHERRETVRDEDEIAKIIPWT